MLSLFLTRYIFPKPQMWRLILNQRCTLTSTLNQDVRKWFSNTSKGGVPHGSWLSSKKKSTCNAGDAEDLGSIPAHWEDS